MLLLAVDTSGRQGSLALVRAESSRFDILSLLPLEGRMYSAQLVPALQEALQQASLRKTDLDAFVVASGPGSFTGLRVGLSTIKAFAEVFQKPIAAVSVLEAAARVTKVDGPVLVAMDAGRKQAFVGEYGAGDPKESLLGWDEFFGIIRNSTTKAYSPDAPIRAAAASQNVVIQEIPNPHADTFARIGYEKLLAGVTVAADLLEANYLRASDAELFSLPKLIG
ncbi:MAG TPA: tRNA (adenosine(37)-N6)-threonylcarbamoyltransferase complex dimerization subunit type 1 TsaB [Terriglobales bacterium]|nr:tRNA (adenosine(37)-N6)-threonylcarbamoyltransferase complex dimerization subunit type 1 TsaB [Terriglobales bacterium]